MNEPAKLTSQVLTEPASQIYLDLNKRRNGIDELDDIPHLSYNIAPGLAMKLLDMYTCLPQGTIYGHEGQIQTPKGKMLPTLHLSLKPTEEIRVPAGQDAEDNGVFNFFYEEPCPLIRLVNPTVSLWQDGTHAVMDFGHRARYTHPMIELEAPYSSLRFRSWATGPLERVLKRNDTIEIRDYEDRLGNGGTYNIPTGQTGHILDVIHQFFGM